MQLSASACVTATQALLPGELGICKDDDFVLWGVPTDADSPNDARCILGEVGVYEMHAQITSASQQAYSAQLLSSHTQQSRTSTDFLTTQMQAMQNGTSDASRTQCAIMELTMNQHMRGSVCASVGWRTQPATMGTGRRRVSSVFLGLHAAQHEHAWIHSDCVLLQSIANSYTLMAHVRPSPAPACPPAPLTPPCDSNT